MQDNQANDDIIRGATTAAIAAMAVYLGPALILAVWIWNKPGRFRKLEQRWFLKIGAALLLISVGAWFLLFARSPAHHLSAQILIQGWCGGTGLVLLATPLLITLRKPKPVIRTEDFKERVRDFDQVRRAFEDPERAPIGIDLKTGKIVFLDRQRRALCRSVKRTHSRSDKRAHHPGAIEEILV